MPKKLNPKTFWNEIIKSVTDENVFPKTAVESWVKPLLPVQYIDGILRLESENNFAPQVLNNKYKKKLNEIAKTIDESFVDMKIGVVGEKDEDRMTKIIPVVPAQKETPATKTQKSALFAHPVNKKYRFDNFVSAHENALAVGSARGVANAPGKTKHYNPLYIYGNAGVGKTHLLHAIANEITKNNPQARIVLISGEEFFRNYAAHLHKDIYNDFQDAFNKADAVLFDNLHELSGKKESQLELYKIFNKLHQQKKQIVITANCRPVDLSGFQERLITRFQWGLTVKLEVQNSETRTAILKTMLQNFSVSISDEEIEYIVENCSENIHELEGIAINLAAETTLSKKSAVGGDEIREALNKRRTEPVKGFITVKTIIETITSFYKIDLQDLKGKSRVASIAWARQVAAYFLKKYTPMSLVQIGNELGGKNHSTILHSLREVESNIRQEKRIEKEIKEISTILARG